MNKMSEHKDHRFLLILILAVITICMLLPAGCQTSDKTPDSSEVTGLEEIRERGVLKVGATGDYQPMSYLDPVTGEYIGFDRQHERKQSGCPFQL